MDVHHVSTLRPVQPFFIFSGRYRIGLISFFAIFRTRQNPFMGVSAIFRTRQNPFYQRFRYFPDASEPAVSVLSGIIQTLQNSLRNRVRIDACQAAEFFGGSVFDEGIRNRNIQKRS